MEVGRWYLVSAVAVDDTLQLFVDGTNVLQVQDNSLSKGAIGFRDWAGTMQTEYLNVESGTWSRTYDGYCGYSVVQTTDGGYAMVGYSSGGVYLVKTDPAGTLLWNKTYGGHQGRSVVQAVDGGYAIAGSMAPLGTGVYLVKTDSAGNLLWNKTYGGLSGNSIVQTIDGGFAIAGISLPLGDNGNDVYLVKTDSAGNLLWNKTYGGTAAEEGNSIVQTVDRGYVIAGSSSDLGATDVYLVKTDSTGNLLWNKTYGETGYAYEHGYSVVQTSDGGYAIAGDSNNDGPYLVKTNSLGTMQWNKTYGGTQPGAARSVVQTADGGFAIAGTYFSWLPPSRGYEYGEYLVKIDSIGTMQWNKIYNRPISTFGGSLVKTVDGGYAMVYNQPSELVKVPPDDPPFTVNNYNHLWHTSTFTITLTATDDEFTEVSNTYYKINNGLTLSVGINGQPVISTEGTNNKLEYWSVDSLGNVEPHHTLTGMKLDKTAPTGSIVIKNGDAFTTSTSVTLTLTANDATSGVSLARYSNDGVWDTEAWESATASKVWTLTPGDGTKTVYHQIKDNSGLTSSTYSDTIILETSPTPTPTPTPTATPTPTPTSTPTPTPTQTPSTTPTPASTPTPTLSPTSIPTVNPTPIISSSPNPFPSPTPTDTVKLKPTSTASPTPNPTETSNLATSSPSTSKNPSPSPSSSSPSTATPLYLYVVAVNCYFSNSATTV